MADGKYLMIFPKVRFIFMPITRKAALQNQILLRNEKKINKEFNYFFFKNTIFFILCCGLLFYLDWANTNNS